MKNYYNQTRQKGAALIVALAILLVLTILAVSLIQSTSVEEKLVGNYIDNNRVFQAAESVLAFAESRIDSWNEAPIAGGGAVQSLGSVQPSNDTWWQANATSYTTSLSGINNNTTTRIPGYVIEEYSLKCDALVTPNEDDCDVVYRVTVRAEGGRNTLVTLQSLYSRRY